MGAPQAKEPAMTTITDTAIIIRRATQDDAPALRRLAQLDGARLPEGDLVVAEVGGELRAALRISDRAYVADPFFPSKELVGLLEVRARRLRREQHSPVERARARLALWSFLHHRAAQTRPML
jgi:hypothetical protein